MSLAIDALCGEINYNLGFLNADELEVLLEVAEALVHGSVKYGALDLNNDVRDFAAEALEEQRDYLAYRAMEIVKERRMR
jgi:hypothetical protein